MADEIKITASITCDNGDLYFYRRPASTLSVDQTTARLFSNVQAVGTTEEAVAMGADLVALGWCWMRNLDASNTIAVGVKPASTFYPAITLKAGEYALCRLVAGTTYYAKTTIVTSGSSADLEITVLDD